MKLIHVCLIIPMICAYGGIGCPHRKCWGRDGILMNKKSMNANILLANALGWVNVFDAGGVLIGTPVNGAPNSRGQALVPDWCGDWKACGPLLCTFFQPYLNEVQSWLLATEGPPGSYFDDRDARLRYFIVMNAIQQILREKEGKTA